MAQYSFAEATFDYTKHAHAASIRTAGAPNRSKLMRVAKEISALSTSLPLAASTSVFLRVDSQRMDIIRVMITGPEDTPYENGCFLFDIFLPSDYPRAPPGCLIITTGKGTARFNPNLYAEGKVCLSLLGTWQGPGWDPLHSTILQVLVSIQSLIFVSNPYFNEPGYENSMGTRAGEEASNKYNRTIRGYTLKWAMNDMLEHPDPIFQDVIQTHFRLKRHKIQEQLKRWRSNDKSLATDIQSILQRLEAL